MDAKAAATAPGGGVTGLRGYLGLMAGTLTCLMLALPAAAGANTTVTLDARNPNFLDTHVALAAGQTVSITASGDGTCQAGDHYYACPGGPDGSGILCANVGGGFAPGPAGANVPIGAVAAKVGSGTPFIIGHAGTATGPGELYVIYNDCIPPEGYEDNAGSFTVTIGGRASATSVSCYVPLLAIGAAWECTATVADASGEPAAETPTGNVEFSVNSGTSGGFAGSHECTLKPSVSGPTADCAVLFVPNQELPVGTPAPITASYGGSTTFEPSSSSASSSVVHEELSEVSAGCGATTASTHGLLLSPLDRALTAATKAPSSVITVGNSKLAKKQHALGRAAAGKRAIALLRPSLAGKRAGVRLYGLPKPLAAGSTITEATLGLKRAIVKPLKLREQAWLFWESLEPLARYEHASVALLISAKGGRVLARAPFLTYPEVNGKQAAFTTTSSRKLLVYTRDAARHHKRRLTKAQLAALVLASEEARTAIRSGRKAHKADVSHSTLITLVDHIGGGTGETFENEQSAVSYTFARHGVATEDVLTVNALSAAVQSAAADGKTNVTIYLDGHGISAEGGAPIPTVSLGSGMGYVNSNDLTAITRAHPEVQFNFIIDSCYSGRFVDPLKAESNVGVVMTSSTGTQQSRSPLQLEYDTGPTTEAGGRGLVIKNGPSEGYGGLVVNGGTGPVKKPPVELETPDGEGLVVDVDESHEGISPFTTGVVAAVNQAFIGKGADADLTNVLSEARTLEPSYDLAAISGSTTPSPEPTPSTPATCPAPLPAETPSGGWFTAE